MNKVYIITANTYPCSYGTEIEIFGVFDNIALTNPYALA